MTSKNNIKESLENSTPNKSSMTNSNMTFREEVETIIKALGDVFRPLYSATFPADCYNVYHYVPFKNYDKPLDFVNNQIDKISKFLISDVENYPCYSEAFDVKSYFKFIKRAATIANVDVQLEREFDPKVKENVLASIMATTFLDELDKIFIAQIYNIAYNTDDAINELHLF